MPRCNSSRTTFAGCSPAGPCTRMPIRPGTAPRSSLGETHLRSPPACWCSSRLPPAWPRPRGRRPPRGVRHVLPSPHKREPSAASTTCAASPTPSYSTITTRSRTFPAPRRFARGSFATVSHISTSSPVNQRPTRLCVASSRVHTSVWATYRVEQPSRTSATHAARLGATERHSRFSSRSIAPIPRMSTPDGPSPA